MELSLFLSYACALSVAGVLLSVLRRMKSWKGSSASKQFPGPTQFPLIGRVHDLPMTSTWLKFKEWADQYGPIYETSMMGQKFIVISDEDLATDLMVKKGNSFSGRAQIRALIDHKRGPTYVALQDRNETWRTQRKWVHAAMAASSQNHFHGHIDRELRRYLMTLLVDPSKFHSNTRELTGRIMARLAWDDAAQAQRYGEEATQTLRQMSISGNIVNSVTPLWHIADFVGYNPWRKYETAREGNMTAWWRQSLQVAKKRYADGTLPSDTWSYRYLEQLFRDNGSLDQSDEDEHAAACMLGFQSMVGVITVAGPLQYFLMAMVLHPEWQERVQREIDAVCGERMPNMDDYAALPTLRACIKETLRWRSTVPLGVPHLCEQDEEYMGVPIKKGTIILACEWALNRIPSKYPDPENYRPDRWLEPEWPTYMEPLSRYPNLREGKGMHTFGWGRRQCLGQSIADEEMFLFGATVCWAFTLSLKKCPVTGDDVQFDDQATNSHVILEPTPWPMDFKPRRGRAGIILKEYDEVRDELRV